MDRLPSSEVLASPPHDLTLSASDGTAVILFSSSIKVHRAPWTLWGAP